MHTLYVEDTSFLARGFRIGSSAGLAVIVTGALILLMSSLISMETPTIETSHHRIPTIVMPPDRTIESLPTPKEVKPIEPAPEPDIPPVTEQFNNNADTIDIAMRPPIDVGPITQGNGISNGAAIALVRVAPPYPSRALRRNIEGFVDLMFDITPAGKTENIRVVNAQPAGYFESASRKTLAKWKFRPAMEDGKAVPQRNQTTRITYELEK